MGDLFRRLFIGIGRLFKRLFNLGIPLKFVLIFCALVGVTTYLMTRNSMLKQVGGDEDYAEAMRYIEIKDVVEEHFIDPVDRSAMADSAAAAMVNGLGDPWSYFMTADEYRAYQLSTANDYADIGISLVKDETAGGFQVISVYPSSPAAQAGLSSGMLITAVDGEKLTGYTTDGVRTLIRSKLNTEFVLEISNGQGQIRVDCTNLNANAVNYRLEKTGAAYVQIHNFEAGSGQAAVDAIEYLLGQDANALVLDLRNNPGGLPDEIAILLDHLLPAGRLFSEVDKNGVQVVTESDTTNLQIPTCVLINSGTFREAELCAAVLKEWGWATLMGEPTSGNTRKQETIPLSDGSAIRLSTKSYLTPSGVDISIAGGVIPDMIVFNSDASATGTTEGTTGGQDGTASTSNDEQLMAALRLLS
ncbi:MAG: PDZ domain-containing protein [Oscillospiraceae bacterium]|nr:PDZ domain-containing protein [Oscillospiraceae bacterium]